jgi:hypothetical protein
LFEPFRKTLIQDALCKQRTDERMVKQSGIGIEAQEGDNKFLLLGNL